MDTGTVVTGLGVLIALFGYLEIIRRDLRQEIKESRQASEAANSDLRQEIKEVRQASETAHGVLRQEIKESRQASETAHGILRQEIREVRQASETAHKDIQGRLNNVETQLAAIAARVDCVDDKIDSIQRQLTDAT